MALCRAIKEGKTLDEIKRIVSASSTVSVVVNEKTKTGNWRKVKGRNMEKPWGANTPLHYAAKRGDPAIVEFLLAAGAKAEKRNAQGKTSLMKCRTSLRCAELLVNAGANVNAISFPWKGGSYEADLFGNLERNEAGSTGVSPLYEIVGKGSGEELGALVDFLLRRGASPNFSVIREWEVHYVTTDEIQQTTHTPFSEAIERGVPIRIIRSMLEQGATDVKRNKFNRHDFKPLLFHAADINVVELLLDFGFDPNVQTTVPRYGYGGYQQISILQDVDDKNSKRTDSCHKIAKLLISRGAKLDFVAKSPYVMKKRVQKLANDITSKASAAAVAAAAASSSPCRLCGQKRPRN